jgi:tRNA/tmRNA/rRNA uracil-C5-methylase (TrmA/RlmC/RlmD family)
LDKLFTDKKYNFESKSFYKKNSASMDKLISYVLDFVKISETGVQGEEEHLALGN